MYLYLAATNALGVSLTKQIMPRSTTLAPRAACPGTGVTVVNTADVLAFRTGAAVKPVCKCYCPGDDTKRHDNSQRGVTEYQPDPILFHGDLIVFHGLASICMLCAYFNRARRVAGTPTPRTGFASHDAKGG